MPVYARINVPWGMNEFWMINEGETGNIIFCQGPEEEYPNDPYVVTLWIDFTSSNYENEFTAGQVIEINGGAKNLPVTDPTVIFRKP